MTCSAVYLILYDRLSILCDTLGALGRGALELWDLARAKWVLMGYIDQCSLIILNHTSESRAACLDR